MSEVDVFTAPEKRLRDLAASFSRLRYKLQFVARLHSGIAIPARAAIGTISAASNKMIRIMSSPLTFVLC